MNKLKANAAELVLAAITVTMLATSCASTHYTCPSYGGVTEEMLGEDMYANQTWGEDEQSRPNYVFLNY